LLRVAPTADCPSSRYQVPEPSRAYLPWGYSSCRVLYVERAARYWVTRGAALDSFPSPLAASRLDRPSHLSARVHPLVLLLPFEVSSPYLLVTSRRPVLPGFLPSSRHHGRCPLIACALRRPLRSVLRLSQPLDGFLHLHAVRACFVPLPRPGFLRSGISPDPDRASAHRRIHSPMPLVEARSPFGCHANLPRLRGFTLGIDALCESVV